jgi:hypothetical protein
MIGLLDPLPRLPYGDEIDAIVAVYFSNKVMPLESGGDAHHRSRFAARIANANKTHSHSLLSYGQHDV